MGRYPYTYAADYVRTATVDPNAYIATGMNVSRAEASRIRQSIARAIGMDDEELAQKLADQYLRDNEAMTQPSEEAIRKACEEAAIIPCAMEGWMASIRHGEPFGVAGRALLALARRIEAEREAVPVADTCQNCGNTLGISD